MILKQMIIDKTENLTEKNKQIENQNNELIAINEEIKNHNRRKGDIIAFIRSIFMLFNEVAHQNKIAFTIEASSATLNTCFYHEKMERIIYNLLSNAFKSTNEGGKISIAIEQRTGNIQIDVTDTGSGLPTSETETIFEPFSHINNTSNPASSRINLRVVKRYVELHKGTIEVSSRLEMGSKFTIIIPIVTNCPPAHRNVESPQLLINEDSEVMLADFNQFSKMMFKDRNIDNNFTLPQMVIVEPDNDLNGYLTELLSPIFSIMSASTYDEGIDLIEKLIPDVVLTDVLIGAKNGYQLSADIKETAATNHIPVIVLSAFTDSNSTITAMQSGVDAIIHKPLDFNILIATIENALLQRKRLKDKYFHGETIDIAEEPLSSADQAFLSKLIDEVEKNITNSSFDVEALCKVVHLSQPQTYRKPQHQCLMIFMPRFDTMERCLAS